LLDFEKDIARIFTKTGVSYAFNNALHVLDSSKLSIHFMPNLTTPAMKGNNLEQQTNVRIWEDIYYTKPDIIRSRVESLLGLNNRLHGRETVVKNLEVEPYADFLEEHHLLGKTRARHRLGLYSGTKLVAVAGFGRSCPVDFEGKTYKSNELVRFCNHQGITVVGGLSKLIKHFVNMHQPQHLMTYVDREWSDGSSFVNIGFKLIDITGPQEFHLAPKTNCRYRQTELISKNIDYSSWQKVANLGNLKLIKIIANP